MDITTKPRQTVRKSEYDELLEVVYEAKKLLADKENSSTMRERLDVLYFLRSTWLIISRLDTDTEEEPREEETEEDEDSQQ